MRKATLQNDGLLAGVGRQALGGQPRGGRAQQLRVTPTRYLELLCAFRSLLDKRTEVKRTARSSTPTEVSTATRAAATRRPAHTRSTTRPRASRACTQEELTELRTAQAGRDGQEGADGHRPRLEGEKAGHI